MKSNKCFYCNGEVRGSRRHFCSDVCNSKYWSGVYSKKWKEGDSPVMEGEIPTQEELKKQEERTKARRLAYFKYKKGGILQCDICKTKTKNVHRHHENYKSEVCILVCAKCHGLIKRYNNLRNMLNYCDKGGKEK